MQNKNIWLRSHLSLLAAYIIYGINFSVAKGIMPVSIRPFALVALRVAFSAILFWIASLFVPRQKISKKDMFFIFQCSFLGVIFNQVLFIVGLNLTTPIVSSIILTLNPIAAFIFVAVILKEHITIEKGIGLAIGLTGGLILILQNGRPDFGGSTFIGNIITLLSTVSWALYTVVAKRLLVKYHPVNIMKWAFLFAIFTTLPLGYPQLKITEWSAFNFNVWASIIFVVVGATFLGYLLINYGLKNLSPTVVSSYNYVQPFIAALFASLIGQDRITWIKIISAAFIFSGVYFVSFPEPLKNISIGKFLKNGKRKSEMPCVPD